MGIIRDEVERGHVKDTRPLTIQISKAFFQQDELVRRKQTIEVLDLPGDDSREEREVDHVDRCLEEYLPHCSMCIVMENASQVVALSQIKREHVSDWMWLPHQFTIVLSKALSSASVKDQIRSGKLSSASELQGFFSGELYRHVEGTAAKAKVYPLDFGDTWAQIKQSDPELYDIASPWMDELFLRLAEDLSSIYTPEYEIKALKNMESLLQKKKKENYERLSAKKNDDKAELEGLSRSLKALCIKIENQTEKIKRVNEVEEMIEGLSFQQPPSGYIPGWTERSGKERSADSLKSDFYYALGQLEKEYRTAVNLWNLEVHVLMDEYALPFSPIDFQFAEKTVHFDADYVISKYFRQSSFNRDLDSCSDALEEASVETLQKTNRAIKRQKQAMKKSFRQKISSIEMSIALLEESRETLERRIESCEKSITKIELAIEKARIEWEHDIQRSKELNLYLKAAFVNEIKAIQDKLFSKQTSPLEKWAYHQYWNIITADAERITEDGSVTSQQGI